MLSGVWFTESDRTGKREGPELLKLLKKSKPRHFTLLKFYKGS
jgi:hypothetical protein